MLNFFKRHKLITIIALVIIGGVVAYYVTHKVKKAQGQKLVEETDIDSRNIVLTKSE